MKNRYSLIMCLFASAIVLFTGTYDVQAQSFRKAGPVDVNKGQITIIQIEDGTPAAATMNYALEIEPTAKSGLIYRAQSDGRVSPLIPEDEVQLKINVKQAGTYYLFGRMAAADGSTDSFFVGIDGDIDNDNYFRCNITPNNGTWHNQWVTSETLANEKVPYDLTAGQHIINWHNREPNARVDWVGITDNPDLNLGTVVEPGQAAAIITASRNIGRSIIDKGQKATVTITVQNPGTTPGSITVKETVPTGWQVSNAGQGGTVANGVITWNVANLAGGASTNLTYEVTVPANATGTGATFSGMVTGNALGDLPVSGQVDIILPNPIGIFQTHLDIGNPGADGSATYDTTKKEYTIEGSGHDIWDAADDFHFAFSEVTGNFAIKALAFIDPLSGEQTWAKAGPMVRDNATPGSAFGFAMIRAAGEDFGPQWRDSQGAGANWGGDATLLPAAGYDTPVEIERIGDTLNFYYYDQANQGKRTLHLTHVVPGLEDPVVVGLAVTSHTTGQISAGTFSQVELRLYSFTAARTLPSLEFTPGKPVAGVKLTANVREGMTPNLVITETPPAGWAVSNLKPSAGTANVQGGNIVWNITGATGNPTLTYDVTPPAGAKSGAWTGSGSDSSITMGIDGPVAMNSAQLTTVYFIGGSEPALPRNSVYIDLLSTGLTLLDENNQQFTIPGLGFQVDFISDANDSPSAAAAYKLVFAHETVGSSNVARYIDLPVPYLVNEQVLAAGRADREGGLWYGPASAVQSPAGDYALTVTDNTHPITQRYTMDQEIVVTNSTTAQVAGIVPDQLAPAAKPLAITGLNVPPERVVLAVTEKGAAGFTGNSDAPVPAGSDPAPARRAYLGYHEMTQVYDNAASGIDNIAITKEGAILFQRVVQWLLGFPVTADGTPAGVQPPAAVSEWSLY